MSVFDHFHEVARRGDMNFLASQARLHHGFVGWFHQLDCLRNHLLHDLIHAHVAVGEQQHGRNHGATGGDVAHCEM